MDSSMAKDISNWSRTHTEVGLFLSHLFTNQNCPDFCTAYINDWKRVLEAGVMEQMAQSCLVFPTTAQGQGLIRSYPLHAERWKFDPSIFDVEAASQAVAEWFTARKQTLNTLVMGLEDFVTGIESPNPTEKTGHLIRKRILGDHIIITRTDGDYTLIGQKLK